MAQAAGSKREEVEAALNQLDYVRFTLCDLNGVPRGKVVPAREARRFLDGLPHYFGAIALGSCDEIPDKATKHIIDMVHTNFDLVPDFSTFHTLPWAGANRYHIGELFGMLCNPRTLSPHPANPRQLASHQLRRLDAMGYSLFSGWELEFDLFEKGTKKPIVEGHNIFHHATLSKIEGIILDFEMNLHKVGVAIDTINLEYHPGQIEMVTKPQTGIQSVDGAFLMKSAIREMAYQKGYDANYMAIPDFTACGSGFHYSHSILQKESGLNVLYDQTGKDSLSDLARYWVGGLLKHLQALSSVCSPTVNCYRRLHKPWAPGLCTWNMDDRMAAIRVKNDARSVAYIENRLPSTAANPYLVLAATMAAGIDGIVNKIEPPAKGGCAEPPELPHTLQEALTALKADEAMVAALGEDFVTLFTAMKEEIELTKLGHHNVKLEIESELAAEFEQYSQKL